METLYGIQTGCHRFWQKASKNVHGICLQFYATCRTCNLHQGFEREVFLIISDLTIVEYSNATMCEQTSPAPAMQLQCAQTIVHYNTPQPRVQVVDHSFSGYA